jgi:DNA polymerase-3 subunit beta
MDSLKSVVDVVNLSQVRPEISGIYFVIKNNEIKLVGTDSFRLAEKTITDSEKNTFKNFFGKEINFILPQRAAKELINILSDTKKNIKIYLSESQVLFETQMQEIDQPEVNLISRLIEGEYPTYQDIVPKDFKTRVVLDKENFINQIKLASLFAGRTNEIKLKIDPKRKVFEILACGEEFGESKSNLSVKSFEGERLDISFNWRFILDGLLNIKSSEIYFEFQNNSGPVVLRPIGDLSYFYIVMPIKPA